MSMIKAITTLVMMPKIMENNNKNLLFKFNELIQSETI